MSSKDAPTSVDSAPMSKAESEATVRGALKLEYTVLIGIFGKTEAPSALLRNPDGTILKIDRGDETSAGTVVAIDADSVRLQKSGKVQVLRMPKL